MTPILAAAIILVFIGVGELVSMWTRARIPALLVTMLIMFVLAQVGIIPGTLVETSTLVGIGALVQPAIMVHMGTIMPLRTVLAQWKSIVIATGGMLVGAGVLIAVLTPLFGLEYGIAGAGPLVGGIVSTALTSEGINAAIAGGADITPAVAVIPALILMLQSLPSMPLTNWLLRRYVQSISDEELEKFQHRQPSVTTNEGGIVSQRKQFVHLPEAWKESQLVMLAMVFVAATLAYYIGVWTGVSYSIWGLLIGIALAALGVLPDRALERSNTFGFAMAVIVAIVAAPLMTASFADVLSAAVPVILILLIGMAGILVGGFLATKLVKQNSNLGMSVALTAMYGFPADYLLVQEVVRSNARDADHAKALTNAILPPMLIGGFTSVSAGSIIIASVLIQFL